MTVEQRATYRLQLNSDFTLQDADAIVDYLSALGISHVYSSPVLQAAPGSSHGYDVVDPQRVSEALGGERAWRRLTGNLAEHQMRVLLDIVPNHMAIDTANPWWWDVLANGPSSKYASYFDVDWDPPEERNANQILLPVLGDHFGQELEDGKIQVAHQKRAFYLTYYDHCFPLDPATLDGILRRAAERCGSQKLSFLADAFAGLPNATRTDKAAVQRRQRDQKVLGGLLRDTLDEEPATADAVNRVVSEINQDPDFLEELLRQQNYRLAFWRVGEQETSYRRFFNIDTLIGLRVEDEQVFDDTHQLILHWLDEGTVDGLRIDHPDGLRDPEGYLKRLATVAPDAWLLVEKILEEGESLPLTWPVAGTTGYDFLNHVNGLFVDPTSEQQLTEFYARFSGEPTDYQQLVYEKKRLVVETILASDRERLADLLFQILEGHRRYRDYTRDELRNVLTEIAACMPVYRTYVRPDEEQARLRAALYVDLTLARVQDKQPDLDADLLDFCRDLLLLGVEGELEAEFVSRFQQFTGPVMAKGVEDTAFYCYNRLVSLNEVGGNPARFGVSPDEFHAACAHRQERWPFTLLATSTHDTKRSEGVRARLNVLSEIPAEWEAAVMCWTAQADPYRTGEQPDANDEYLLYQTLVGAWPISEERVQAYMQKAARESKRHTSWADQNEAYEQALADFVTGIMNDEGLMADLSTFVEKVKRPGRVNSLAQTLIKLTAPGIPDLYQGTELWDLSLVDPDNRRPVDYELRRELLSVIGDSLEPEEILTRMDEGLPKLWVIVRTLQLRAARPELFSPEQAYKPLTIDGTRSALAFMRGDALICVVPRLTTNADRGWETATVKLPEGVWHHAFTGEIVSGEVVARDLLSRFPVALLNRH